MTKNLPENITRFEAFVREVMENITVLSVPLTTEAKSGINWGNLAVRGK